MKRQKQTNRQWALPEREREDEKAETDKQTVSPACDRERGWKDRNRKTDSEPSLRERERGWKDRNRKTDSEPSLREREREDEKTETEKQTVSLAWEREREREREDEKTETEKQTVNPAWERERERMKRQKQKNRQWAQPKRERERMKRQKQTDRQWA